MTTETKDNRAEQQAQSQFDYIKNLLAAYHKAEESGESVEFDGSSYDSDGLSQLMQENPLEVSIRSGWYHPGEKSEPFEFNILLCTGGPAVRIIGDLGDYNQPESARLEYQDWFTVWTEYPLSTEDEAILVEYCQQFYFGE